MSAAEELPTPEDTILAGHAVDALLAAITMGASDRVEALGMAFARALDAAATESRKS